MTWDEISSFAMTPERFARLRAVLDRRQADLTVLLDKVHKPHNLSAVLRSCDATGVFRAHAVWPSARFRFHRLTSGGAGKWVGVVTHPDIETGISSLRTRGYQVVAAHPGTDAVDFREVDYTQPTALILGAELTGISRGALDLADRHLTIPMAGHVASLNVSVAAAVILFEAQRQRQQAGMYDRVQLSRECRTQTLFEWAHPRIADYCRRHRRAYPALDENGAIIGDAWRS